jgi:DNA-binding response OmpR family regulator
MIKNLINKKYRILCIDDSKLNRAFIVKILTPLNISVDEAENGIAGLEMIDRNSYDLILLDIIMPEMDGFGFLKEFSRDAREQFIPVILMTGLDDLNAKIKGLSTGADDYLLKPLNEQELIARVFSLLRLKNANSELYEKNMLIKKELEAAKKIQRYIVPSDFSFIDYPSVSGIYKPIEDIGGDFFDCYKIDENRSAFLIADVTGHGIPAALL